MKKKAAGPKLKNFFSAEPSCVVHGAGTKCVTGRGPSFSKKAEYVFKKLAQEKFNIQKPGSTGMWGASVVKGFDTSAGKRYYAGTDSSKSMGMAQNKAVFNARMKFQNNPADSITTQQFKAFK